MSNDFKWVFPAYTLQLPSICVLPPAFKTFCSNKLGNLTGQVGIFRTYHVTYLLHGRMKVPHLMSIRPMECWLATLNASSAIMSHALKQVKTARIRVICKSASIAPHFLLARVQLSICFPMSLSSIHLTASLYLCPADCFQDIMFEQAGNSHRNKLASLRHITWHAPWAHESTSLDVNKAKGMLTSHAKPLFCDNVTCFGTSKNCSNQSHLQECLNCNSLLACMLFLNGKSRVFSGRYSQHPRLSWP